MRRVSLIIIVLLIVLSQNTNAQSGFMGKKVSLGYSLEALPYFNILNEKAQYPTANGGDSKSPFEIVTGHHVNAGIVVTRRLEIFASAGMRTRNVTHFGTGFSEGNDKYISSVFTKGVKTKEMFYSLGFRRFFKKYIAPVGFYHQYVFGLVSIDYASDSKKLEGESWESNIKQRKTLNMPTLEPVKYARLGYGLGLKKMLTTSFFMNVEGNIYVNLKLGDKSSSSYDMNIKEYGEYILQQTFQFHRRFDAKLGVGFLL